MDGLTGAAGNEGITLASIGLAGARGTALTVRGNVMSGLRSDG